MSLGVALGGKAKKSASQLLDAVECTIFPFLFFFGRVIAFSEANLLFYDPAFLDLFFFFERHL